jgi:hypothetical protein
MTRSSGLQLVGIMLVWVGIRFLMGARTGSEDFSDPGSLTLVLSAVVVGGAALFAALAVFRGTQLAPLLVTVWAVVLFVDLLLQETRRGPLLSWGLTTWTILAGVGALLFAVVVHVRYHAAVSGGQYAPGSGSHRQI